MDRFLINDMARSKANQEALSKLEREVDEKQDKENPVISGNLDMDSGEIKNVSVIESRPGITVMSPSGAVTVNNKIIMRCLNLTGGVPTHKDNLVLSYDKVELKKAQSEAMIILDTIEPPAEGMLKFSNNDLQLYVDGDWRILEIKPNGLYDFTTFTFTTGNQTGPYGPTLQTLLSSYNTSTYPWLNDTNFFKMSGYQGVQEWTVPKSGDYKIESTGAGDFNPRGAGVKLHITTALTEGEVIRIVCGQKGQVGSGGSSGGSGGSFVVRSPYNTNASIILIAGGGGGQYTNSSYPRSEDATQFTFGLTGNPSYSSGGTNGNGGGGNSNSGASGGGGFFSNGGQGSFGQGGSSFLTGSTGGVSTSSSARGGFGGGASTHGNTGGGGGGGGYSGGGGGYHDNTYGNGGGGGSYGFNGITPTFVSFNEAPGFVTITKV